MEDRVAVSCDVGCQAAVSPDDVSVPHMGCQVSPHTADISCQTAMTDDCIGGGPWIRGMGKGESGCPEHSPDWPSKSGPT